MQRYVQQLLTDIESAKKRPTPPKMELTPDLEVVRGAEEFLYGQEFEMEKIFGLEKQEFPPIEKLNTKEIESLANALLELWEVFHFSPVFPEGLPAVYQYKLLVSHLDHKTTFVSMGTNNMEFCDYETENCPFPDEFCMCKDF